MLFNEEQLKEYGRQLGSELIAGDIVALTGNLGSGKTVLTKAIALGLGVTETVTSPTFTLINEYGSGRLPLYHFDVYRPSDEEAEKVFSEIGIEEYFYGMGISVVEWAERVSGLLPENTIWIKLAYTDDLGIREVTCNKKFKASDTDGVLFSNAHSISSDLRTISASSASDSTVPSLPREKSSETTLAIETTGPICSVILRRKDGRIFYRASEEGLMHLTSLLPIIRGILEEAGLAPANLSRIAVSSGPGSFTGIRIGVATVRAIAQTLNIPVIKVPTLETFVYLNLSESEPEEKENTYCIVCPIFDARRNQVYSGAYLAEEDGRIMTLVKGSAYDPEEYFCSLDASIKAFRKLTNRIDSNKTKIVCRFMGDGLQVFSEQIEAFRLKISDYGEKVEIAEKVQDAKAVLSWAEAQGVPIDYKGLSPIYMRKAEAQRRLDEKEVKNVSHKIREANENDVYGISVIERLSFGEPWLEQSIYDDMRLEYSDYLVCEDEGFISGYAGLHRILSEGHITNIAVHPSVRGKGVGTAVLEELMKKARGKGIKDFTLEVRESDEAAVGFYKRQGFISEGKRKDYYPCDEGEREDALIMWLREERDK